MIGRQAATMGKLSALLASTSLTTSCAFLHHLHSLPRSNSCSAPSSPLNQASRDYGSSPTSPGRVTLEKIVESLKEGNYKKILVVAGAGVSCSAGIPDVSLM